MAAARSRISVPIFRPKSISLLTESDRQSARRFSLIRDSSSSSAEPDNPLLHKLLKAPVLRIKATLDSEFTSDPPEFPWASLLTSLHAAAAHKANLVIEWKLEKLINENGKDQNAYAQLISLCRNIRNLPTALLIFSSMEAQGFKPTSSVFNSLISTSLSSGNFLTAISLFEIMENSEDYKPDSDTYDAFISAYANLGNKNVTEAWFCARKASGFFPDALAYGFVISCCVKSKNFDDAERYYQEMMLAGIIPNESIFQNMLLMNCLQRNSGKVTEFMKLLLNSGSQIDRIIARKVVSFYLELRLFQELENLLVDLGKSNQTLEVLSLVHCSIIRMYADADRLDKVEYSVERMLKDGVLFSCPEDVEKVICCYFRWEAYDRLDLFLERVKDCYKFTRSIYDLLGAGYRRAGLLDKLNLVANEMKLAGLT